MNLICFVHPSHYRRARSNAQCEYNGSVSRIYPSRVKYKTPQLFGLVCGLGTMLIHFHFTFTRLIPEINSASHFRTRRMEFPRVGDHQGASILQPPSLEAEFAGLRLASGEGSQRDLEQGWSAARCLLLLSPHPPQQWQPRGVAIRCW